ncbi:terpenoid synthase [Eremomyces bilateralis CBS 781.70]|uniref:Terpene synthase n=1 Tax=Eremomyces bilateralis CBS 781.70 TaxID=1392243 RepID=A0A6G1GHH9_9PEZI|nr:terpenoid synthase [Eremomyces bilateralis CBS 781.70]KAF1817442.1 terpenoid synthase [Eremomyces bilateralis CBS 781.70]
MILDRRTQLLESIRGQRAYLPDLRPIFAGWPGAYSENVNEYYELMIPIANARLDSVYEQGIKLSKLKRSDFALFAASWWPQADFTELKIMLYMSIWLFTWDDEIDEPGGSCTDDFDAAQAYRKNTIEWVSYCLGLWKGESAPVPQNRIIESFQEVGEAFRDVYSVAQRQRYYDEMIQFLAHSQVEQEIRLRVQIPGIDEYWAFRMGTSAVGIAVAAVEYADQVRVGDLVMQSPSIRAIRDETIIMISITNDLLSLKKEISAGCIDSIVPITYSRGSTLQQAIDVATEALQASKNRFEIAADRLKAEARLNEKAYQHVDAFVEANRKYCVGNLTWSLATGRYGMAGMSQDHGKIWLTL